MIPSAYIISNQNGKKLLGISYDTLGVWQKTVQSVVQGKNPYFSPGDILTLTLASRYPSKEALDETPTLSNFFGETNIQLSPSDRQDFCNSQFFWEVFEKNCRETRPRQYDIPIPISRSEYEQLVTLLRIDTAVFSPESKIFSVPQDRYIDADKDDRKLLRNGDFETQMIDLILSS